MDWDDVAPTWDSDEMVRAYARAAAQSLEAEAARREVVLGGGAALDFGCGTGLLTERLVDSFGHIDAVDVSPAMLAVLDQKVQRLGWTQVSVHRELPSDQRRYDLIVCSSVCGFLEDYPGVVRDLARRLEPGGLFVQWDWELDPDDEGAHGLTRDAIRSALTGAGLTDVTVETGFSIPAGEQTMSPLMGAGLK